MRKIIIRLVSLMLLVFIGGCLLTPTNWRWSANNLQVRLHNVANERSHVGSAGCSAGWSKLSLFVGDWWRWGNGKCTSKTATITDCFSFHLVGAVPTGVWVRVKYQDKFNNTPISFDQVIFVTKNGTSRVDISPDFYLTGMFE